MERIFLYGRYGLNYPCTYNKKGNYYFIDTSQANYISVHYDDNNNLVAIDPEGLYIISVGVHFNEKLIKKIEPTTGGYNIYLE